MELKRGASAGLLAALAKPFHPVMLALVAWPTGAVRVHSGFGSMSWDGHTWLGVGDRGFLRLPEEGSGIAAANGVLRLGGLPEDIDAHLSADARGAVVQVWFGVTTDRAGSVLAEDPVQVFVGYVDSMADETVATQDGWSRILSLNIAAGPSQRARASVHHTDADQKALYPADTAGRWVIAASAAAAAGQAKW